jgi:hypothetical protein
MLQRLPILAVAYRGRVLLFPGSSLAFVLYDWLVLRTKLSIRYTATLCLLA